MARQGTPATLVGLLVGCLASAAVSFADDLLRLRDNGGGFFVVGAVEGFEQLIATADDDGPSQSSQTDSAVRFTDVRGPALKTGGARVCGIDDDGLFIQVVVDMVGPAQEFFASGGTYRLGSSAVDPSRLQVARLCKRTTRGSDALVRADEQAAKGHDRSAANAVRRAFTPCGDAR